MTTEHDGPEPTAVRVALWRALHRLVDPAPHVLVDDLGLALIEPDEGWRRRPDMDPDATGRSRASIVARARFIEDLVLDAVADGIEQYVLLGAGLDTFALRRPASAATLQIFEVDQPAPQAWKRRRLTQLAHAIPNGMASGRGLHFVPVDFEAGAAWWEELAAAGFDAGRPAVIASTGVAMYLTREANVATLARLATFAPGSTLALSFMVPLELVEAGERPGREATERFAALAGTPFRSLFAPEELLALARHAGFRTVRHVAPGELTERYFAGRRDGLRPSSSEHLLLATT